ncbi:MAG: glycosyltransferase family 4 protein [Planctomycetes bacterium]|nr:glycosyltransferase family 4 protein [Planctomycetota bacterium]
MNPWPEPILHLFANFKWTGPADPAIRCAAALRRLGADVCFAQAAWTLPRAEHRMALELARARMPVIGGLELRKHFALFSLQRDAVRLARRLQRGDFALLHTHLLADHLIAALARRRARRGTILVRSLYEPEAPRRGWRERLAFGLTDGVVAPTRACAEGVQRRFGLPPERILVQEPPVPQTRRHLRGDLRDELGLRPGDFAIGITARIQRHRCFDLLWEVARRVVDQEPRARFVLLGRGNERDTRELVTEPVARLRLQAHVILPGYLYEPRYSLALRSLQAFCFLVPGSDGTCRAVREAMALGLPVVATRRGMLPELLGPGPDGDPAEPCGLAVDEDAGTLAAALTSLLRDPARREALVARTLRKVEVHMDESRAAQRLLAFYAGLARGAAP